MKEKGSKFGKSLRFEKSQLEKWKKQIKVYNEGTDKEPINPNRGP
jgi:hypothetical protein